MLRSRYIIADLTDCNPNVFYELGIAHSFKDAQNIIILKQKGSKTPFDITHLTYIEYEPDNPFLLTSSILNSINETKHIVDLEEALRIRDVLPIVQSSDCNLVDFLQGQLSNEIPMLTRILLNEHLYSNYSNTDIDTFLRSFQNSLQFVSDYSNTRILNDWLKCYSEIIISCDKFLISAQYVNEFLNSGSIFNLFEKSIALEIQTEFAINLAKKQKGSSLPFLTAS